ncbi:hypothetical protein [Paenibacillus sp. MMO-177]|uniref:hypothetical protein n=1 Tax=Paenibacillus sp. MMO-177 TaxID=3081289 RepID=UPI00301629EC
MKEFLKKHLIHSKRKQVTALLVLSTTIALTGCGTGVDKDFAADTKALISTMDDAIKQTDVPDVQNEVKFYMDKWGKESNKKEIEAIKHVGQAGGYVLLYSTETDSSKRDEIRKEYIEETEAAQKAIK